jgi:flagellum-specific peptidoglycan hydrolase FlgJ
MTPEEYILSFKEAALRDMARTGVPASITIAQGIYESDCGNSPLAREAKNHFGIKCHKEWNGPTYHQDDDDGLQW